MNVIIKFLASCTCFENHVFINRKTVCTCNFYGMIFIHLCQQSSRWNDVLDLLSISKFCVFCTVYCDKTLQCNRFTLKATKNTKFLSHVPYVLYTFLSFPYENSNNI